MNEDLLGKCRACGRQVSRKALECREPNPTLTEQEYGVWWKYYRDNNMFDKPNEKNHSGYWFGFSCFAVCNNPHTLTNSFLVVFLLNKIRLGVSLLRCFGRLREVVLDRELVVVFRPGGCSVFKLKLKYKVD